MVAKIPNFFLFKVFFRVGDAIASTTEGQKSAPKKQSSSRTKIIIAMLWYKAGKTAFNYSFEHWRISVNNYVSHNVEPLRPVDVLEIAIMQNKDNEFFPI